MELEPGDKVLVKLDAFRSQRRKLKNQWSGNLHTVVKHVADRIPTYVVKNDETGRNKCSIMQDCYSGLPSMTASLSK